MDYKTGNPGLNEKTFATVARPMAGEAPMTLQGTVNKSFLLLVVLLLTALWSWTRFYAAGGDPAAVGATMLVGLIGGLVLALIIAFKQTTAPYLAVPYAALEGLAIGGISAIFEKRYPGIAIQAVSLTFAVLFVLLLAYKFRIVQATRGFRLGIIAATGGIALLYLVNIVMSFGFHRPMEFLYAATPLGIGISLVITIIAALNLILDFDLIERGAAMGAPKYMEWYGAFAMMVTLIWLYMEILRLLSKMRRR